MADGGSLFKTEIVNRICDESLKRNFNEDVWYIIAIKDYDEGREIMTKDFQWDDENQCWIIRHIERTPIHEDELIKWEFEKQYMILDDLRKYMANYLKDIVRHYPDRDEDDDLEIQITLYAVIKTIPEPGTRNLDVILPSKKIQIESEFQYVDNDENCINTILYLTDFAKCGFRSIGSFKKSKNDK